MPDQPLGRLARLLRRLLPAEVRERVFDPALNDAYRRILTERGAGGFARAAIRTYLGCLPMAIPRLFVSRGRLTPFSRVCIGAVLVIVLRMALQAVYY